MTEFSNHLGVLIFLPFTVHLSQVTAIDLDGPPNNFIMYSIVNGDPKQQFSIDPRTGHITVLSMLDREEVSFSFTPESPPRTRTHLFYQGFSYILWSQMNILITTVHIWLLLLMPWCSYLHNPTDTVLCLSDNALLINCASCWWRRSPFILCRPGDSDCIWRQRQPTDVLPNQSQPRSSGKNTHTSCKTSLPS